MEFVVEDDENAILFTLPTGQAQLYADAPARRAANGHAGSFIGVLAGDKIRFSVDVKASNQTVADTMRLTMAAYNGVGLSVNGVTGIPVGEWTRLEITAEVTLAPSGGYVRTMMWPTSVPEGEGFFARNALVQIGSEWPPSIPYFDGDTQGFEYAGQKVFPKWDGTPNESTSSFEYFNWTEWNPTTTWNKATQKRFSVGVDRGMLYLDGVGVPWAGLTAVNRRKHDGENRTRYIDGQIYRMDTTPSDYAATINAYTYPDEFDQCIGNERPSADKGLTVHGQMPKPFSFSYRTLVGDGDGVDQHYKIHLVYNAMADELDYEYATMTETTDLTPFSFDIVGVPVNVDGHRPTSYFSIDSREVNPVLLRELEHVLYGKAGTQPSLPSIEEIRAYLRG